MEALQQVVLGATVGEDEYSTEPDGYASLCIFLL